MVRKIQDVVAIFDSSPLTQITNILHFSVRVVRADLLGPAHRTMRRRKRGISTIVEVVGLLFANRAR